MHLVSELFKLCFSSRSLERCTISSLATLLSDSRKIVFPLYQTNISFCLFSSKISKKKKKGKRKHSPISESLAYEFTGIQKSILQELHQYFIFKSPNLMQALSSFCLFSVYVGNHFPFGKISTSNVHSRFFIIWVTQDCFSFWSYLKHFLNDLDTSMEHKSGHILLFLITNSSLFHTHYLSTNSPWIHSFLCCQKTCIHWW